MFSSYCLGLKTEEPKRWNIYTLGKRQYAWYHLEGLEGWAVMLLGIAFSIWWCDIPSHCKLSIRRPTMKNTIQYLVSCFLDGLWIILQHSYDYENNLGVLSYCIIDTKCSKIEYEVPISVSEIYWHLHHIQRF